MMVLWYIKHTKAMVLIPHGKENIIMGLGKIGTNSGTQESLQITQVTGIRLTAGATMHPPDT